VIICATCFTSFGSLRGQTEEVSVGFSWQALSELSRDLNAKIESILAKENIPGAVIAVVRGDQSYIKTFGVKSVGYDEKILPTTAFDIGSCSKAFAATAAALLVQDGKIELDDPLHPIVPELRLYDPWIAQHVSFRDLLANRVGVSRQVPLESYANHEIPVTEILSRLEHTAPAGPFRTTFSYWNPGFMTVALTVARVSGMPYEQFLQTRIFDPLKMKGSASGPSAESLEDAARGHVYEDGAPVTFEEPAYHNYQGSAGVFLSGSDALQWLKLHLGRHPEIIDSELLQQLHLPHTLGHAGVGTSKSCLNHRHPCTYALGWNRDGFHDRLLIHHAGGQFGWHAYTAFLPETNAGVVVFLNVYNKIDRAIALTVLDVVLGNKPGDWYEEAVAARKLMTPDRLEQSLPKPFRPQRGSPASLSMADYAGTYHHPGLGDVVISRIKNGLKYQQVDGRIWDGTLLHVGADVFELHFEHKAVRPYVTMPPRVRFQVQDGKAVAVHNVQNAVYQRVHNGER
jgi:CubicO group peptidase (beta-lactamase class C family)